MKKILFTGAASPQGSMLLKALSNLGYPIRLFIENAQSLNLPQLRRNNLEHYLGDLTNFKDCVDAMQGCQCVIHAGLLSDFWPFRSYAVRKSNLLGTIYLLRAARFLQLERFIQIDWNHPDSTISTNSRSNYLPEQFNSAQAALQYVQQWIRDFTFPAAIVQAEASKGPWSNFLFLQRSNPMDKMIQTLEFLLEDQLAFKPDIQTLSEYKLN